MDGGFSTLIKKKKSVWEGESESKRVVSEFFPAPLSSSLFITFPFPFSPLVSSISVKREKGRCRFIRFRTNLKNAKAFLKFVFPSYVSLLLWCATNCTLLIFSYIIFLSFFFGYFSPPLSFPLSTVLLSRIREEEDFVFEPNRSPFPREMNGVYVQLFNAILQ